MANNAENEADCARDQNDGILATLLKCKNYSEIKKVVDANSVFSGFDFPIDTTEGGGKKGPKSPKYVEMCKQAAQAWIKGAGASKGNTEHDIAPYDQCLHGLTALLSASSLPPDLREHLVRAFEATEGRVKELQDGLKKVAHEQRETKREVARLASRPAPPTPAVEPTRQEKRETAARSAEEHFKEQGERDERKLDLRVRVMGGKTPTPGDEARSTLQTMLHERLGFSEGEAKSIMDCYVGRVLVLQAKTGFTLLVTFKDDKDEWMRAPCFGREKTAKEVQAWVYAHRHAWRKGPEGPRLAIGYNLTAMQRERQATLFPLQQQAWQQGAPVRMEYTPAVLLVVAGRTCHNATQVAAAVAIYQKKHKDRQQQPNGR